MLENLRIKKDEIQVLKILPDKGIDKWAVIDGLIRDYTFTHKEEVKEVLKAVKELRKGNGWSKGRTLKNSLLLPVGLNLLLKKHFPEIFKNKKDCAKFQKKFKGFTI